MADELRGWKEIAAHFGVTDRTAQRWEQELNLPVHRMRRGGSSPVFAMVHELEGWRHSAEGARAEAERELADADRPNGAGVPAKSRARFGRPIIAVVGGILTLLVVLGIVYFPARPARQQSQEQQQPSSSPRRQSDEAVVPAGRETQAHAVSSQPFEIFGFRILFPGQAEYKASAISGEEVRLTLPSGLTYALAAVESSKGQVQGQVAKVVQYSRGGEGVITLKTGLVIAPGVRVPFKNGNDVFSFELLDRRSKVTATLFPRDPSPKCSITCADITVSASEARGPCGACCAPGFLGCQINQATKPKLRPSS